MKTIHKLLMRTVLLWPVTGLVILFGLALTLHHGSYDRELQADIASCSGERRHLACGHYNFDRLDQVWLPALIDSLGMVLIAAISLLFLSGGLYATLRKRLAAPVGSEATVAGNKTPESSLPEIASVVLSTVILACMVIILFDSLQ